LSMAALQNDANEVIKDMTSGNDALGAIVKIASKKDKRIDYACHFMNPVGFECADRNRVPILAFACVLGVGAFACAICGALGLGPGQLEGLEWGGFDDVPFDAWDLVYWYCGERVAPLTEFGNTNLSRPCVQELFTADNSSFHSDFGPIYAGFRHAGLPGCDGSGGRGSCARYFQRMTNAMIDPVGTEYGEVQLALAFFSAELARANWHLNQWGLCLFPNDEAWHGESFVRAAMLAGMDGRKMSLFQAAHGGICRPWEDMDSSWMSPIIVNDCKAALRGGIAPLFFMAQVMCCFGAFMLIPNAIGRMNPRLDQHHKTITLIILGIANVVPNLIQILQFNGSCRDAMSREWGQQMGKDARYGTGITLFTIGFGMSVPSLLLHLIIPSATRSAFDPPTDEPKKVEDTAAVEMQSESV